MIRTVALMSPNCGEFPILIYEMLESEQNRVGYIYPNTTLWLWYYSYTVRNPGSRASISPWYTTQVSLSDIRICSKAPSREGVGSGRQVLQLLPQAPAKAKNRIERWIVELDITTRKYRMPCCGLWLFTYKHVVTVVGVALDVKTKAWLHQMPAELGYCMENDENVGATVGWLLIQQYI